MIIGIGTDIIAVGKFKKWLTKPELLNRFFHPAEMEKSGTEQTLCRHFAARMAAKEAFAKAAGTGLSGFNFRDVYIEKDCLRKPFLRCCGSAETFLKEKHGNCTLHVSLSHDKDYATAVVIIEV